MILVALTFCMSMPSLVILATLGIFVAYILNTILITYYYSAPKLEDVDLVNGTMTAFILAIVINMVLCFWQLSNPHQFDNVANPMLTSVDHV